MKTVISGGDFCEKSSLFCVSKFGPVDFIMQVGTRSTFLPDYEFQMYNHTHRYMKVV